MDNLVPDPRTPRPPLTPEILVPRIGDHLVEKGLLTEADLQKALRHQAELRDQGTNILLGEILVRLGMIDRVTLDAAVTEQIILLRAALQETNAQLEKRVQERTQELQNALLKLSELNQLKSNFIANISHELRTPLTHIKGYVELLVSGAMGDLNDQQLSSMQVVQRSTERLEQQIEDLIRFSLVSRGEFTLRLSAVDLKKLGDQVISRSLTKAKDRQIELVNLIPTDLSLVKADEEKLSWALLQLLDNAIKFTGPNGKVSVNATYAQKMVDVYVEDNGIGIPSDRLEEIFEPFHQLDGSATRRYGGTGLGLALVRQIVEAHGTSIRVESTIEKGSRFHFTLTTADGT
jgi:signal transduction histidine kinase